MIQSEPDNAPPEYPWEGHTGSETTTTSVEDEIAPHFAEQYQSITEWMGHILVESDTVELSLDDLRPENVPVTHYLELKDSKPIYSSGRLLPPKHNNVDRE